MTNIAINPQATEEEIFAFDVSDEALEIAAGTAKEKANFTLGACTGLSVCPS
jgi:methylase of polypeptide subunit release factors